jgi:hypothetical protein
MPSKAGRRRGEAAATMVTTPVSAVPPPGLDPAVLGRPLRRGYEVERFNQLALRQTELTPAESDELYAYRLRRLTARERGLQRALISGSEEELRNAIVEQERRLTEVRGLEELRQQAGLPAGYEGDRELEVQARERLAELARLRLRGLVAGQGQPPEMDERQVRLPEPEFRPGADRGSSPDLRGGDRVRRPTCRSTGLCGLFSKRCDSGAWLYNDE